jgi:hypothetical protein
MDNKTLFRREMRGLNPITPRAVQYFKKKYNIKEDE